MNTSSLTLNIPWAPRRSAPPSAPPSRARILDDPTPPPSATLDLARTSNRMLHETQAEDTFLLLFLAGCSLAGVITCALSLERFLAHWDAFEAFVRASVG
jgi:hypothetical protein